MRFRIWSIVVAALLLLTPQLFAQEAGSAEVDDEGAISRTTMEVSNEVMSPFCPGKTLAMCPSPAAAEVRRDIQEMARAGNDSETIKKRLIEEYGDEFSIVEPDRFDNAVILGLVAAGLVLCFLVVLMISKRGSRKEDDLEEASADASSSESGSAGEDGEVDDPYLKALRDEYKG